MLTEGLTVIVHPTVKEAAVMPLLTSHHATARPGDDGAPGTSRADTPVCGPRFPLMSGQLEDIVKLKPTAVSDAQHGGFTTGVSPVSWGSIDELFVT